MRRFYQSNSVFWQRRRMYKRARKKNSIDRKGGKKKLGNRISSCIGYSSNDGSNF